MRVIRLLQFLTERALARSGLADWLACRRYRRILGGFAPPGAAGSRLPRDFQERRRELRRRRLHLEMGLQLDRIAAEREAEPGL